MDRLEKDLEGQVRVLRLSVMSPVGRQLAAGYGVRGVPTFILFDDGGQLIRRDVGRVDADYIRELGSSGR